MINNNKVFLLLGGNIEPRYKYLSIAEEKVSELIGEIIVRSKIYESEPMGFDSDTLFLNRVIVINTKLMALDILKKIHLIEIELGRNRDKTGYSSRTIDIDILYFNSEIINNKELTIPHLQLHKRRFTLLPLVEIAPDFINPVSNLSNTTLLDNCSDNSRVTIFDYR